MNPTMNIDFNKASKKKGSTFKVGDHVRTSKYIYVFTKGYIPHSSGEVLVIKKVKNILWWTYVISDFNDEEITGTFYEKELQKNKSKRA